jgi:hypothetical protein
MAQTIEQARYHTVLQLRVVTHRADQARTYQLLLDEQGQLFEPLLDYFLELEAGRPLSWQRVTAQAVGLFIDFLRVNGDGFQHSHYRRQVFPAFAEALVAGTMDQAGVDHSELYWRLRRPERAKLLLNRVTRFADWLAERFQSAPLNPWREATYEEQIAYWRRFDRRRAHELLGHTKDRSNVVARSQQVRLVGIPRKTPRGNQPPVNDFPNDRISDLLLKGFINYGQERSPHLHVRYNVRNILITLLLHGGGLRVSEAFHLYVQDVGFDSDNPNSVQVRLYHPELGRAPDDYRDPATGRPLWAMREEYLRVKYARLPRNQLAGSEHAGWKDLYLTDVRAGYALVFWFPAWWGEVFLTFFKLYIHYLRPANLNHPYLFVNHDGPTQGQPYTLGQFTKAHRRAVRRIGLEPAKYLGTTPHGHRHAYGRLLTQSRIEPTVRQLALHHKSLASQAVYSTPRPQLVTAALQEATQRLRGERPPAEWQAFANPFSDVDPLGLVSGPKPLLQP